MPSTIHIGTPNVKFCSNTSRCGELRRRRLSSRYPSAADHVQIGNRGRLIGPTRAIRQAANAAFAVCPFQAMSRARQCAAQRRTAVTRNDRAVASCGRIRCQAFAIQQSARGERLLVTGPKVPCCIREVCIAADQYTQPFGRLPVFCNSLVCRLNGGKRRNEVHSQEEGFH